MATFVLCGHRSGTRFCRSDPVRLTSDPGEDSNPTWAHDDADVMFTSDRAGNVDVYLMARDGSDIRNLTQSPARDWAPTGRPQQTSDHPETRIARSGTRAHGLERAQNNVREIYSCGVGEVAGVASHT